MLSRLQNYPLVYSLQLLQQLQLALGLVITGSTLTAVSAQGNMTAGGGGNMTAGGGGDIVQQLKSAAVAAKLIDNKKMFIIACEPLMTDPDTQCVVANLELR